MISYFLYALTSGVPKKLLREAVCSQMCLSVETIILRSLHSTFLVPPANWLHYSRLACLAACTFSRIWSWSPPIPNLPTSPPFPFCFVTSRVALMFLVLPSLSVGFLRLKIHSRCCTSVSSTSTFHLDTSRKAPVISSKVKLRQFSKNARSALSLRLLVAWNWAFRRLWHVCARWITASFIKSVVELCAL